MKRKLLRLALNLTIIAALSIFTYIQFFCFVVKLTTKSMSTDADYKDIYPFDYSILLSQAKMTSWNSQDATLSFEVYNDGDRNAKNDYDVNITLVDAYDRVTMLAADTETSKWSAKSISEVFIPLDLSTLGYGKYTVYVRIWDDESKSIIPLDNKFELTKNGYQLGTLTVSHPIFNI